MFKSSISTARFSHASMLLSAAVLGMFAFAALVAAVPAQADVTPTVTATFPTTNAAGRHSDWRQAINFNSSGDDVKRLVIDAPTGLMGNPTAVPSAQRCGVDYTQSSPSYGNCPASSDVGDVTVTAQSPLLGTITLSGNIYLLRNRPNPAPELPSRLGIHVSATVLLLIPIAQDLTAEIVTRKNDTGLRISVLGDISRTDPVLGTDITITSMVQTVKGTLPNGNHFLWNPTRCDAWETTVYTRAYGTNGNADTDLDPRIGGNDHKRAVSSVTPNCSSLPSFDPSLSISRTTNAAGAPTGLRTSLNVPTGAGLTAFPAYVKQANVTYPLGTEINPALAKTVGSIGCLPPEFNMADPDTPPTCPASTNVGSVEVNTPLLSTPLVGNVYLGAPGGTRDARYRLLVYIGGGLNTKLEWRVTVADSGQISVLLGDPAVDKYLPQFPFTSFALDMKAGPGALVTNPQVCGNYTASIAVTPWTSSGAVTRTTGFPVTAGSNGSCAHAPFAPSFAANLSNTNAGAPVDLTLTAARGDRQDNLRDWKLSLPTGLVGSLTSLPQCAAATAAAGNCGNDTKVGTVVADVGSGPETTTFNGTVHLAEGDANTVGKLNIQVPSIVGPYNLGTTVVQSQLRLRGDGGIDAFTAGLPQRVQGVPVRYRKLEVKLNGKIGGKTFLTNPTRCGAVKIDSTLTSAAEQPSASQTSVNGSDNDQAITGCESLGFGASFAISSSSSARNTNPDLDITTALQPGGANLKRLQVVFPPAVTVNTDALTNLCTRAELDAAACGPLSRMGSVTLDSPLLPFPLTGSAYVAKGTLQLPDLVLFVNGPGVALRLDGTNDLVNSRIVSNFDNLPDLAFGQLKLHLDGGKRGLLRLAGCPRANGPIDVSMFGQGGQSTSEQDSIAIEDCALAAAAPTVKIRTSGARKRGNKRVAFSFALQQRSGAPALSEVQIALPRGGRVAANSSLRRSATATAGGKRLARTQVVRRGGNTLRLVKLNAARSVSVKTTKSAVTLPYKLVCGQYRANAKGTQKRARARCLRKQITFTVRTIDVGGTVRTTRVKVRASSLK